MVRFGFRYVQQVPSSPGQFAARPQSRGVALAWKLSWQRCDETSLVNLGSMPTFINIRAPAGIPVQVRTANFRLLGLCSRAIANLVQPSRLQDGLRIVEGAAHLAA